ncbi:43kDa postsynaptic protein [Trema orientale]|uniref:RING-type E3 ubiquitin transferase n=1 Tax=Trema orientale TaxID=63057 RepID=A0A2P5FV08_TREOI|nr:43kDa postsynaptic protein [Trema orientale]
MENMLVDGMHFASHWNALPRSDGYSFASHSVEIPHYPSDTPGPSHDPFQHPLSAGTFSTIPETYIPHASSSNYDRQPFQGVEGSLVDLTTGNVRGPHKRKSPGIPSGCERGSTSRYHGAGSSSDHPIPSELHHEKVGLDTQHMPWDRVAVNPSYRGNGLSIRTEGSIRNVRSRSTHDLESNLARTHLSGNPSHNSYPTNPIDHPSTLDLSGQPSAGLTREWNHFSISSSHGRVPISDTSAFSHEPAHFLLGGNSSNEGYHDFIQSRSTAVPQSYPGTAAQSVRGVRSSYSQRPSPTFRASSSSLRLGHVAPLDEGLQLVAENYSRHPRPLSNIGWRNGDRNGRSRISNERYRLLSEETGLRDRFTSEGFMIVDRSALYGSRNMADQHREMRLDVDNMSYEELLALGERIGSVNTGLSEDLMFKCVTETIYCSSDQIQEEGSCVICLEEYEDMDDVGTLKTCGHDFHVSCIKKWLSMKNLCPICKASALADNMKDE